MPSAELPLHIAPDAPAAAGVCAMRLAALIAGSVAARGRCVLALSGGESPRPMLALLAQRPLPWQALQVVQVDERLAPAGDPGRNLTMLEQTLVHEGPLPRANLHPMPVELAIAGEAGQAIAAYEQTLQRLAGTPPVLDVVHLGLGDDGHTASLFGGDALLELTDRDVDLATRAPRWQRLSLTLPMLNRARHIVWFVLGAAKAPRLAELVQARGTTPALRIARERAEVIADEAACRELRGR